MSEGFLATAAVRIAPDVRGFQAALRTQVKKSISTAGIFKVPITPELSKFRAAFKAELRSNPISVPVVPDISGFREALQAKIKTASKGVAVTVPVLPGKVPQGAASKGVAASATATTKATASTIQLTAAQQKQAAQEAILNRIAAQRHTATTKFNKSLSTSIGLEERSKLLKTSLHGITNAEVAAENALATAAIKKNRGLVTTLKLRLQEIQSDKTMIATASAEANSELAVAAARDKAAAALSRSAVLGTTTVALRKQDNALLAVEAELELAAAAAKSVRNTTSGAEIAALEAEVLVRRELIATELAGIKTSAKAASQQAFAARGAGSSALSLLKVRGATLAANSSFLIGAASFAIFAKAVGGAAKLETELNVFRLTANATAIDMERVREVAVQLGSDITLPAVSAADAASAFTNLAKAGLDVRDSVDGARGVLQLATAAQIENAEATELVASALNSFSLNGDEATHVADLLTGAANAAQGSISDMGIALQQSSAVARQAGLSLEDTVAFITLLAKNGIRGSDAGTSLRTSLLRLIAPTEDAAEQFRLLGISILDTAGNIRPDVFSELQTALAGLDATTRNQTLRKIFGQDAIRAAVIFGREGATGLDEVREATNKAGLAAELAGARTAGFAGQIEALRNNLATLGTVLGGVTLGPLGLFAKGINTIVSDINALTKIIDDISPESNTSIFGLFDLKDILGDSSKEVRRFSDDAQFFVDKMGIAAFQLGHVRSAFADSTDQVDILAKALTQDFGDQDLDQARAGVDSLVNSLKDGDAQSQALATRLQVVLRFIQEFGRKPTIVELKAIFDAGTTRKEVDKLLQELGKNPVKITAELEENSKAFILSEFFVLGEGGKDAFRAGFGNIFDFSFLDPVEPVNPFPRLGPADKLSPEQITNRLLGFDERITKASIAGNVNEQLQALRDKQTFIQQQLARKDITGAGKGALVGARRQLQGDQESTQDDITSILDDQASASKDATDKIKDAKDKADDALRASFDLQIGAQENRILEAAGTKRISDDIKQQTILRNIIKKQTAIGTAKINDQKELASFLQGQEAALLKTNQEIADLKKKQILGIVQKPIDVAETRVEDASLTASLEDDIRAQIGLRKKVTAAIRKLQAKGGDTLDEIKAYIEQRKAIRQEIASLLREQQARIRESIELDVEFADIGETEGKSNAAARIRARERLIAQLKKEQALTKRGSVEWKRLRNQIATEQEEIAALKKQAQERNNAFNGLVFEFMQKQEGFAANLLGNLIPGFATAGLVGGTTSAGGVAAGLPAINLGVDPATGRPFRESGGSAPTSGLQAQAASKASGPTFGQAATEVSLLAQVLQVLREIQRGRSHPEARYQRDTSNSNMDGVGGV